MSRNKVAVLICTYRGAQHLHRQVDTIAEQTHTEWTIHASDDGSDDGTAELLQTYQRQLGEHKLRIYPGPRRGFAANFFSLIARKEIDADFYAFTDQDDEWDASKLERAIGALSKLPAGTAGLYGSRSELIDQDGRHIGFSKVFTKRPGFSNALVQNMVSGNTMVLNANAMELIRHAGADVQVSAHDWWAYLLVTGSGGTMLYDTYPTIRYRQHGSNLYGANVSWRAKWVRVTRLFAGDFRDWNAMNVTALRRCSDRLTAQSRNTLDQFDRARRASALGRLFYVLKSGVYRQTWDGQLGLLVAAITGKI
jgi:glycosyltransferase involved in cell wall biosynthesis